MNPAEKSEKKSGASGMPELASPRLTTNTTTTRYVHSTARVSNDLVYRYDLQRTWVPKSKVMLYIMLNPSTADGESDDPTIRVCMGRAERMGYGKITVVNLFAYRATDPRELYRLPCERIIGPENDYYIREHLAYADYVICAWGNHGNLYQRDLQVREIIKRYEVPVHHLGLTLEGQPRHPLRISYSRQPELWT